MSKAELDIVISKDSGFAGAEEAALAKAEDAFESLGETLAQSILPLRARLEAMPDAPDELEIKLELAFKGEAKWVVVSAGAQATVGIKAVWKRAK